MQKILTDIQSYAHMLKKFKLKTKTNINNREVTKNQVDLKLQKKIKKKNASQIPPIKLLLNNF